LLNLYAGTEKNPLEIKPTYSFWAPFIGSNCRRGRQLINSEFRKANHKEDLKSAGATSDNCSIEKLTDLFCEGKVCYFLIAHQLRQQEHKHNFELTYITHRLALFYLFRNVNNSINQRLKSFLCLSDIGHLEWNLYLIALFSHPMKTTMHAYQLYCNNVITFLNAVVLYSSRL
jgi:hypothetical protein